MNTRTTPRPESPPHHIDVRFVTSATEVVSVVNAEPVTEELALRPPIPVIPGPDGGRKPLDEASFGEVTGAVESRGSYGEVGRIAARSVLDEEDEPLPSLETGHKAGNMPGKSRFGGSLGFLLGRGKLAATRNASPAEAPAEKPAKYSDDPDASTVIHADMAQKDFDFSNDIDLGGDESVDDFAGRAATMRREHGLELLTPDEVRMSAGPLAGVGDREAYEYRQAQAAPGVDNRTFLLPQVKKRG